jgi:hypothetical protein
VNSNDTTFNAGRNAEKRRTRAATAKLKGARYGWKKALRLLQTQARMVRP